MKHSGSDENWFSYLEKKVMLESSLKLEVDGWWWAPSIDMTTVQRSWQNQIGSGKYIENTLRYLNK